MALSNWDTLAVNEKGESTTAVFKARGMVIEIYKNWLYIKRGKNQAFAHIEQGKLRLDGVEILAVRGPQQGVYCACWTQTFKKLKSGDNKCTVKLMAGCGVYGFKDTVSEILAKHGVERKRGDLWCDTSDSNGNRWLDNMRMVKGKVHHQTIPYWNKARDGEYDYSDDWAGVTKESLEFLKKFVNRWKKEEHIDWDEGVGDLFKTDPLRYNQGDAYFAKHLDEATPATKVGKTTTPMLIGALKHMKVKPKKK